MQITRSKNEVLVNLYQLLQPFIHIQQDTYQKDIFLHILIITHIPTIHIHLKHLIITILHHILLPVTLFLVLFISPNILQIFPPMRMMTLFPTLRIVTNILQITQLLPTILMRFVSTNFSKFVLTMLLK